MCKKGWVSKAAHRRGYNMRNNNDKLDIAGIAMAVGILALSGLVMWYMVSHGHTGNGSFWAPGGPGWSGGRIIGIR